MSSTTSKSAAAAPTPSRTDPSPDQPVRPARAVLPDRRPGHRGRPGRRADRRRRHPGPHASTLAPYAFGGASVAGILAFLLSYRAAGRLGADIDHDSDVEVEVGRDHRHHCGRPCASRSTLRRLLRGDVPSYAELRGHGPPGLQLDVFQQRPRTGDRELRRRRPGSRRGRRLSSRARCSPSTTPWTPSTRRWPAPARRPATSSSASHPESRDEVLREFFLQATSQVDGLRHRRASGLRILQRCGRRGDPGRNPRAGRPAVGREAHRRTRLLVDIEGLLATEGTRSTTVPVPPSTPVCSTGHCTARASSSGRATWSSCTPGGRGGSRRRRRAPRAEVRDARRATGFRQSRDLPAWLWDHQVALFATDTFAVEVLPVVPDSPFLDTAPEDAGMMHQELIAKLGVPLGELWNLTDLVADSRAHRPMGRPGHRETAPPRGGVGSPPNATAIR